MALQGMIDDGSNTREYALATLVWSGNARQLYEF
jgi:hypothetical protein